MPHGGSLLQKSAVMAEALRVTTDSQGKLGKRVARAAGEAVADHGYVNAIDVFTGIGWLNPIHVADWRKGRIPCLEKVIQANLSKVSRAMELFRAWAGQEGLQPSETAYLVRTRGPQRHLRFSRSGEPRIERPGGRTLFRIAYRKRNRSGSMND